LGEFSPIRRLYSFGQFFVRLQKKLKFLVCLFPWKELSNNFDKNGLGYTLGNIVKNLSGHPAVDVFFFFFFFFWLSSSKETAAAAAATSTASAASAARSWIRC
jgi:hypothetical protein